MDIKYGYISPALTRTSVRISVVLDIADVDTISNVVLQGFTTRIHNTPTLEKQRRLLEHCVTWDTYRTSNQNKQPSLEHCSCCRSNHPCDSEGYSRDRGKDCESVETQLTQYNDPHNRVEEYVQNFLERPIDPFAVPNGSSQQPHFFVHAVRSLHEIQQGQIAWRSKISS
jgi:hypothetical protein